MPLGRPIDPKAPPRTLTSFANALMADMLLGAYGCIHF